MPLAGWKGASILGAMNWTRGSTLTLPILTPLLPGAIRGSMMGLPKPHRSEATLEAPAHSGSRICQVTYSSGVSIASNPTAARISLIGGVQSMEPSGFTVGAVGARKPPACAPPHDTCLLYTSDA